ncbi:hypothetical protein AGMMS49992_24400 [Clostridia bacterium]|nr:hypothetical protein AGMMS49992_24400 [Clostridia bacterium]
MKKALALIMTLAIILTMTTAVSVSFAQEAPDVYGKYPEPIKITVLSTDLKDSSMQYDSSDPTRKSATQNAWIDAYLKYLNIEVEKIVAENEEALNARISTGLASGDLPDIIISSKTMYNVMAENGVLQDLTEAYDNYSQGRLLKEAVGTSPESLSTGIYDGEFVGFPQIGNAYNNTKVLHIRQDWLDAVGMEAPKTIDEMIAVAKAFQAAKLGGENTIGLGMTNVSEPFFAAYGVVLGTWTQLDDGSYVRAKTLDAVKPGLLKLQEMYKDGVIKSDFAVTNILKEEVANSQVGMLTVDSHYLAVHRTGPLERVV